MIGCELDDIRLSVLDKSAIFIAYTMMYKFHSVTGQPGISPGTSRGVHSTRGQIARNLSSKSLDNEILNSLASRLSCFRTCIFVINSEWNIILF